MGQGRDGMGGWGGGWGDEVGRTKTKVYDMNTYKTKTKIYDTIKTKTNPCEMWNDVNEIDET